MTSTHEQLLADDGSETRPAMLERGSYVPWVNQFMRYIKRKRDTRKFFKRSIEVGPYKFKEIPATATSAATNQTEDDLAGDDLKYIWKAFGGSTRDLDLIWEETGQDCNSTEDNQDLAYNESLSEAWTLFKDLLQNVPHHGIDLWLKVQIFYDHVNPATRHTIDQSADGKLRDKNAKESWALIDDLALYDNESWNDPRDFIKPVKAISLPHDVPNASYRHLVELEIKSND
ncbi:hypothetical protein Tco_1407631 [Tanacetum coccineum]